MPKSGVWNIIRAITVAAIVLLPVSCCRHNDSDDSEPDMSIKLNIRQAGTKAVIDDPDSQERIKQLIEACYNAGGQNVGGFGVYGFKKILSDAPYRLFDNTRVRPDDDVKPATISASTPWIYRPLRFWDKTATYQFIAYWPHLDNSNTLAPELLATDPYVDFPTTVNSVDDEVLTIHNIPNWQYVNGTEKDLMTATAAGRYNPDFSTTGTVSLSFRHLLSQLIIKAYYVGTEYPVTGSGANKSGGVRINGISLSEYTPDGAQEEALLKAGQSKFQVLKDDGKTDFTQTLQTTSNTTVSLGQDIQLLSGANVYIRYKDEMQDDPNFVSTTVGRWLMVPHRWYKLNLTVDNYEVGTEDSYRVSKTVPVQLGQQVYDYVTQPGRTYVITLLFNTLEGGLQVESVVEQTWTEHNVPRELYNL